MLYRERLTVPAAWWVLAALLAVSLLAAVGFYLGPVWGIAVAVAAMAVAAGLFWSTAVVIEVDDEELRVGRAVIGRTWISGCAALDVAATDVRGGTGADARAHLVLRPYVPTAVEITLDDPADPVPYWLVSSRRPTRLAAALGPAADAVG
ncbi:Protein of unknown function [Friedmanniella luteola]|uniref:DUF3093 domain-containing protein n=1 Tax=Friedmanniella luteola TaxID=546871 RepID=A0A1H1S1J3_9ACTN|nr:DUF3093 domain-containing protein [Friedmanniella luteola]SDS41821.1 Protein of unknown function [Friedmanniella luteola]